MSLYVLTLRPGFEGYTARIGWDPHHTLFCSVIASSNNDKDTGPGNPPDSAQLGLLQTILDPAVVVAAAEPYALIPDDLINRLRADMDEHPVRRPPYDP